MKIAWFLLVALVSIGELLPSQTAPIQWIDTSGVSDKIVHFAAYAVMAAIPVFRRFAGAVKCSLTLVLLGIALEFLQRFVPGRSFDLWDIFMNTTGVLTGIAFGYHYRRSYGE